MIRFDNSYARLPARMAARLDPQPVRQARLVALNRPLAARLGLDAAGYERTYFAPAFKLLDDPAACDRVGPAARPLIERLKSMGGDTVPLTQSQ